MPRYDFNRKPGARLIAQQMSLGGCFDKDFRFRGQKGVKEKKREPTIMGHVGDYIGSRV